MLRVEGSVTRGIAVGCRGMNALRPGPHYGPAGGASERTGQVAAYWRGNERSHHDAASDSGPDRRLVAR